MSEKKPKPGTGLVEGLSAVGLEMIKGGSRLFLNRDRIYVLGPTMTPMIVTSERGFIGVRLRRKRGGEEITQIKVGNRIVRLPDLEVQMVDAQFGVLNRYVLFDQEALIDDGGRNRIITQGFLFWGH